MISLHNLQIFLTLYYGSIVSSSVYDYIIRNIVHFALYGMRWTYISNIIIGLVFVTLAAWLVWSVWSRKRMNLFFCLGALIIMFAARLAIGIPDLVMNDKSKNQNNEDLAVFITQMIIHLLGIVATWFLIKAP